jgi:hypothetical protein
MDEPTVELVETSQGPRWRVCGLGYCTEHQQRWQAEVLFECLMVAKGCRNQQGRG